MSMMMVHLPPLRLVMRRGAHEELQLLVCMVYLVVVWGRGYSVPLLPLRSTLPPPVAAVVVVVVAVVMMVVAV